MNKEIEALECLANIAKCIAVFKLKEEGKDECNYMEEMKNVCSAYEFKTIKQDLIKAQKEHKALDIIKEKKVNILLLELTENVDEYNERIVPNGRLTDEEFNLLKEILE